MLQGESHVSRGPILLLGNSICHWSRFAECLHKSRKKKEYNSSYSELGPPVPWVISLSLRLRLITHTLTLIILDITETSSNNCLYLTAQLFSAKKRKRWRKLPTTKYIQRSSHILAPRSWDFLDLLFFQMIVYVERQRS